MGTGNPPDARGLYIGISVPYSVEYEGDPKLCKCKYKDSGSIKFKDVFTYGGKDYPGSGEQKYDKPSDTHEFSCDQAGTDHPGIAPTIGPAPGSVSYSITYDWSGTVSCEGSDGSTASDTKSISGNYSGSVQIPGATK